MTNEIINFNNVPVRKPMKEPRPDLKAVLLSFPEIISPTKAPKKGPSISPSGAKKIPTNKPNPAPQIPYFEPPSFFVPQIGTT